MDQASHQNERTNRVSGWRWVNATLIFLLAAALGWLFFKYTWQTFHILSADDQTAVFEELREKAIQASTPYEAVGYLDGVVNYYPSGSKQDAGTQLDRIVERARRSVIHDIISHLRIQTGQDLGDDPAAWIARFRPHG